MAFQQGDGQGYNMAGGAPHNRDRGLMWDRHSKHTLGDVERLTREIAQLTQTIESTRTQYNAALAERDQLKDQAKQAEIRLAEVHKVVSRYAVVEDPVVASDGYTYEKKVIQNYLSECRQSKSDAISQQTKEVLSDILLPNQSLRKLVDLLKEIRPEPVAPLSDRHPVPPFDPNRTGPIGGLQIGMEKPRNVPPPANDGDNAVLASDLEASWSAAAAKNKDRDGKTDNSGGRSHPCIRVYGYCNYKDECAFAKYPYDACLNNIKGKCRFGSSCKELHVNPVDQKFRNPKAQQSLAQAIGQANRPGGPPSPTAGPADDKRRQMRSKPL